MKTLAIGAVVLALGCGKKEKPDDKPDEPEAAADSEVTPAPAPADAAAPSGPEVSPEDACAMLDQKQAEAALGKPVAEGKPENLGCVWNATEGTDAVAFEMQPAAQFEVAQKIARDMAEKGGPKGSYEKVSKVGSRAFYSGLAGHQIVFVAGDRVGKLHLLGAKDAPSKERAVELASAIAAEMTAN